MPPLKIKVRWDLFRSFDLEETKRKALELGWAENRVQVRKVFDGYIVEPFDNCDCPQIIRFEG
jgi:hypothetical protein